MQVEGKVTSCFPSNTPGSLWGRKPTPEASCFVIILQDTAEQEAQSVCLKVAKT